MGVLSILSKIKSFLKQSDHSFFLQKEEKEEGGKLMNNVQFLTFSDKHYEKPYSPL